MGTAIAVILVLAVSGWLASISDGMSRNRRVLVGLSIALALLLLLGIIKVEIVSSLVWRSTVVDCSTGDKNR